MTEIKPWQDRVKPGAFTGVKMEAMLAEIAELRAALAKSQPVERGAPVAWVRCHPDGTLTDELMPNSIIEVVRKYSGAWVPLFARPVCPMSDERLKEGRVFLNAEDRDAMADWLATCRKGGQS